MTASIPLPALVERDRYGNIRSAVRLRIVKTPHPSRWNKVARSMGKLS